jgi:2-haloacid dehalogenase
MSRSGIPKSEASGRGRTAAPVVALDLGQVCVQLESERCARNLGFASVAAVFAAWPWFRTECDRMNRGALAPDAFFARIAAALDGRLGPAAVRAAWQSLIGTEIPGMAELVADMCRAGLEPGFISDTCPVHFEHIMRTVSFADRVPRAVLSFRVGALKPDSAMFVAMEDQCCAGNVPLLYADDRPENVEAARARGWAAYQFGTVPGLRAALNVACPALEKTGC